MRPILSILFALLLLLAAAAAAPSLRELRAAPPAALSPLARRVRSYLEEPKSAREARGSSGGRNVHDEIEERLRMLEDAEAGMGWL
mmetsp:Transcript_23547/g.58499  ORF Transcript_23547/g.58499 Transcript_23547/m.58499 type:complete len:86 (+) Transcript_23547:258-515(+)